MIHNSVTLCGEAPVVPRAAMGAINAALLAALLTLGASTASAVQVHVGIAPSWSYYREFGADADRDKGAGSAGVVGEFGVSSRAGGGVGGGLRVQWLHFPADMYPFYDSSFFMVTASAIYRWSSNHYFGALGLGLGATTTHGTQYFVLCPSAEFGRVMITRGSDALELALREIPASPMKKDYHPAVVNTLELVTRWRW